MIFLTIASRITSYNVCYTKLLRGKTIIETSALWLRNGKNTLRLIKEVKGEELVSRAMREGKGVILATPHLGAWEGAGLYCAHKYNITCLSYNFV